MPPPPVRDGLIAHIRAWHPRPPHRKPELLSLGQLHRWHRDEHTVRAEEQTHTHADTSLWRTGGGVVSLD